MKRTAMFALLLVVAACSPTDQETTTTAEAAATTTTELEPTTTSSEPAAPTTADSGFPVTVTDDVGPVTIEERPDSIVSLSATATEMLFAIGAGEQVIAVDDQSDFPVEAPMTDLSGFTPNLEAILSYEPDLVVLSFDPADNPVTAGLEAVGVPTLLLDAAAAVDDVYRQIGAIGEATGNLEPAQSLNGQMKANIEEIVTTTGDAGEGVTYYHELDSTFFTVTSETFIGEIYGMLGLENIADAATEEDVGFPQLSSEYIVAADPDIIFLADAEFGESLATLADRPGWGEMSAMRNGAVVELDSDIASRWGPRIVEFLQVVADAVEEYASGGAASE